MILCNIVFCNTLNLFSVNLYHMISRFDQIIRIWCDFITDKNETDFYLFFLCFRHTMYPKR